jgi:hypothetical protein
MLVKTKNYKKKSETKKNKSLQVDLNFSIYFYD